MALLQRYSPLDVTTPPGTAPGAPLVTLWQPGDVWLYAVQVKIPPGHGGQTGLLLRVGGAQVLPWAIDTEWINGDDDYFEFQVGVEVGNGLEVVTYNRDIWSHSHYLRFVNNPVSAITVPATTVIVPVA